MKALVIDYNMGNLQSVVNAFKVIGIDAFASREPDDFRKADCIVLPGVGAFEEGMKNLHSLGLVEALSEEVLVKNKPFLGICLGMQLLFSESSEHGQHKGLGWIEGKVTGFNTKQVLVPHVGWNDILPESHNRLFQGFKDDMAVYFVHSYYCCPADPAIISAECDYGIKFAAAIEKENICASQFHPEKSQLNGLMFIKNFIEYSTSYINA